MNLITQIKTVMSAMVLDQFGNTNNFVFPEKQRLEDQHKGGRTRSAEINLVRFAPSDFYTWRNLHYVATVKIRVMYSTNAQVTEMNNVILNDAKKLVDTIFDKAMGLTVCPKEITCESCSLVNEANIYTVRNQGLNSQTSGFTGWNDCFVLEQVWKFNIITNT